MSRFFGLTPDDLEQIYLEPSFILMYYGGFSWREYNRLPVVYKRWFIERIVKEINKSSEGGGSTQSRAAHHNLPDQRGLMNLANQNAPARLRRFT